MDNPGIQVAFFQYLKGIIPPHKSMVDEIAELLSISNDSAYRRIRGEKPITLEEVEKLASHYQVSLDQFMPLQKNSFLFNGNLIDHGVFDFDKWSENILQQLQFVNTFEKSHIIYLAKDIPLMQQFLLPELAAFKSFFWRKSILHYEGMKGLKFSLRSLDQSFLERANKIVQAYNRIDSTDIWNIESINSTIRQIEFYRDAGIFESEDDIRKLYLIVMRLIDHLEKQAEQGVKFGINDIPAPNAAAYNLYVNELILGDNTLLFELDGFKICFLNHSVINYLSTRDKTFTSYAHDTLKTIIKKSTALSVNSERERTRFFNRVRDKMKLAARL